jgi:uncharacterized protein (DUF1697 family)
MGGHNKVAMSDLRALAMELGLKDAQTLLNSGNLVFTSRLRKTAPLEGLLEREIAKRLGIGTCVMIRTAAEWKKIAASNPFAGAAGSAKSQTAVMFLKDKPEAKNVAALKRLAAGQDYFQIRGREIYVFSPDGFGNAKFTLPPFAKTLETAVTGRNWSTVMKLAALARQE